jgi:hypothetical protein
LHIQFYPLAFDILFLGDLCTYSVDISHNPRVDDRDEGIVDKMVVD